MNDFDEYLVAGEPDKRERAYGWATAIGLQDVDGLKVSDFLLNTAKRNIEGEITQVEAGKIIDAYYETKEGHDQPEDRKEADKVARRINETINSPTFRFSPEYYIGLHGRLFKDVYSHAGKIRDVELTKREWVLNGDTVNYTPSFMVKESLAYDFAEEKKFRYSGLSEDAFAEHFASFISGLWQIHPFREGNTRTVAVFAIKYLRSMRYDVTNALFKEKSWYFRNALVRANYENPRLNVEKTQLPLEEFFKVLIYGYDIELRNRFLRIGYEHGTQKAEAVRHLHRHDVGINVGINDGVNRGDDGVNDGVNSGKNDLIGRYALSEREEKAVMAILRDNRITAKQLADILSVKKRQAERIIASLKRKTPLRRDGADKNGRWVFEEV
ncbi:MAG: Fic family protein [Synergistaceae bacterium]|nr:Fic family protein [Synergistaceae bacterium]